MKRLFVINYNNLNDKILTSNNYNKNDIILILETKDILQKPKHHRKKIVFILSSMRHFAYKLDDKGYNVKYIKLTDLDNSQIFTDEIKKEFSKNQYDSLIITKPTDYNIYEQIKSLAINIKIEEDSNNLSTRSDFSDWALNKKELRMEYFYRQMRLKHKILIYDENKPIGGKWNFDKDNRKFSDEINPPKHNIFEPDKITNEVIKLVEEEFHDHFGDIYPFNIAVTRSDALKVLDSFINERLENFGSYQDAMLQGEPYLFHSHISFYINNGLISPMESIKKAEQAYEKGMAPLNSVEGFIRQILGWREYIRGIYWHFMPKYKELNYFKANNKLPKFYWDTETDMNCLKQCITETKQNAYAHHIQRLMVLGNFLLLANVNPKYVNEWYWIVYMDAYEWVELPNVTGMILYADGGIVASKPYASSGAYINKMSNYCKNCTYDVNVKNGKNACPFNYLYWNFLIKNRDKLENNQRIKMMYSQIDKMLDPKLNEIKNDSDKFLKSIGCTYDS